MPYNHREISLQVAATRLHKVIIETTRVLLLRERREGNPGEAARQGGMQNNEMGKSTMDSDALGIGRRRTNRIGRFRLRAFGCRRTEDRGNGVDSVSTREC